MHLKKLIAALSAAIFRTASKSSGPAVADRLLSIALDPATKSYAAVSACEAVIRSIERGVLDREMREHITKLREQMALLEQGRPIDV